MIDLALNKYYFFGSRIIAITNVDIGAVKETTHLGTFCLKFVQFTSTAMKTGSQNVQANS